MHNTAHLPPAPSPEAQALIKAHEDGKLFAHLLEINVARDGAYEKNNKGNTVPHFFEVLNGNTNEKFDNEHHNVRGKKEGYVGLAATALKKGLPFRLWSLYAPIGILMNGKDEEHVKPLYVSAGDMHSTATDSMLTFRRPLLTPLMQFQTEDVSGVESSYRIPKDLPKLVTQGKKMLLAMWKDLEKISWDEYMSATPVTCQGMNETSLMAHLKAVGGIVVYENTNNFFGIFTTKWPMDKSVKAAVQLRDWISEHYPNEFPKPLPILVYNPSKIKTPLVELTDEQLREPEKAFSGRKY